MRLAYRVGQFLRALRRRPRRYTTEAAEKHLTRTQLELFRRLSPYDQDHAAAVLTRLEVCGPVPSELAQAALLHDVGKAAVRVRLWQRVALVLAGGLASRLPGSRVSHSRALAASNWHAAVGSVLAREAGAPPRVVALIHRHHDVLDRAEPDEWLRALQGADSRS